jgi:hypothetical protein
MSLLADDSLGSRDPAKKRVLAIRLGGATVNARLASRAALRYPAVVRYEPCSAAVALLMLACASGCDEPANATPAVPATTGVDAGPAPAVSSARLAPSSSASTGDKATLTVLKVVFTSDVKSKEPTDKLDHAEPGQRVWVHLTVRNRGDDARPVSATFRVNDDQRSKVDLKIEPSWSYRTWAYNTLRATDTSGELAVDVRDADGTMITSIRLPIKKP